MPEFAVRGRLRQARREATPGPDAVGGAPAELAWRAVPGLVRPSPVLSPDDRLRPDREADHGLRYPPDARRDAFAALRRQPSQDAAVPGEQTRPGTDRVLAVGRPAVRIFLRRVRKKGGRRTARPASYPKTSRVGGESIVRHRHGDLAKAIRIIDELRARYGIDLSSLGSVNAIKRAYARAPRAVRGALRQSGWKLNELQAIRDAAAQYAPILGPRRGASPLAGVAQEVTTMGRVEQAIDENTAAAELDDDTVGEYFQAGRNLALFDAGENYVDRTLTPGLPPPTIEASLKGTAIHELAHGLVEPHHLGTWVTQMAYWRDPYTASGVPGAEEPPTAYGKQNAAEDLCESVAMFFVNRQHLQQHHPARYAFLDRVVAGWNPPQAQAAGQAAQAAATRACARSTGGP
jgi:hypothetical protein